MPRPTLVGTTPAIENPAGNLDSHDFTMTVDADATCILLLVGGYDDAAMQPGTASITSGGSGSLTNVNSEGNSAYSGVQYCTCFVMYDDDANWPGTGAITVTWNAQGGNFGQVRGQLMQWRDVDTAGTPSPANNIGSSDTSGAASITMTGLDSSLDVMVAASAFYNDAPTTESGEIGFADNGASSSSLYVWQEDADGASSTIELAGQDDPWAACAIALRGTSDNPTPGAGSLAVTGHVPTIVLTSGSDITVSPPTGPVW